MRVRSFPGLLLLVAGLIAINPGILFVEVLEAQESQSVAGKWDGTVATTAGRATIKFTLTQDGRVVKGAYDYSGTGGAFYDVRVTGAVEGSSLTLVTASGRTKITGTISGDTISGTLVDNHTNRVQQLNIKKIP